MSAAPEPAESDSCAAEIWALARTVGAASTTEYHDALETARVIDQGRDALTRLRAGLASDPDTSADALAAIREIRLVQTSLCEAAARLARRRRRAALDPALPTPAALDRTSCRQLARLVAGASNLSPATNPLLGDLAGTPDVAARALIDGVPLFRRLRLSSPAGAISLDEIELLVTALRQTLVDGHVRLVVGRSLPDRIRGAVRRRVAQVVRRVPRP